MDDDEFITYEQARAMIGEGVTEDALGKFLGRHRIRRYLRRRDVERALESAPGRGRWGARSAEERRAASVKFQTRGRDEL